MKKQTAKMINNLISAIFCRCDSDAAYNESFENATSQYQSKISFMFDTLSELNSLANSYFRLQEISCNQGLTEKQEKREAMLERKIVELASNLVGRVEFRGDPRGYTVVMYLGSEENREYGLDFL